MLIAPCLPAGSCGPRYGALCPVDLEVCCQRLVAAGGGGWFVRTATNRRFRGCFLSMVNVLLPGIVAHYLARKRCLEEWPRASSSRPVVVLGARPDTLAWRSAGERPDGRFFEVDRLAAPTLFIAEGLAMYLPTPRVASLSSEIASTGGLRVLALTPIEGRVDSRIKFRALAQFAT